MDSDMKSASHLKPLELHTAQFTDAAKPALLTAAQSAREIFNVAERTFHKMRSAGLVPPPVVLGPRLLRWSRRELEEAVASLPRAEPAPEPLQLKRGRDGKRGAA